MIHVKKPSDVLSLTDLFRYGGMKSAALNPVAVLSMLLLMTILSGCAAMSQAAPSVMPAGGVVETLSAAASFSYSRDEQGMGGSGYLLYQRPDRLKFIVLAPFGSTLLETTLSGDTIIIADHTRGKAFRGALHELPPDGEVLFWRQARWLLEDNLNTQLQPDGSIVHATGSGDLETRVYKKGLLVEKRSSGGDSVHYGDYEQVNGVDVATEIILYRHDGVRFRIKLTDLEVNGTVTDEMFQPRLAGLSIHPLASLLQDADR